ncbi:hypothetical protein RHMOL_Rhmol05G0242100 [Rhododendron molle]|uniref:Uncharacterized protein n=1 Tax=Rhododendron molle TaxID=49168 RepID=A0ACC0NSR3_RHOML|nr:hypothetical protein RHMOL_Rhmol05G0242100 [Rhododendron molle]
MVLQEGPIDRSLLTFQQSHCSHSIWANNGESPVDSKTLKVQQTEARLKKLDPSAPPVSQLIRQAGYTEENVWQQARGYNLRLIGGVLMSDHSGSQVHLAYLTLLEDLMIVRRWGCACLSNPYHYLCHDCHSAKQNVCGAFILLQLWSWERFPFVAPGHLGTRERPPGSPLGAWWDDHFHSPDLATYVVGYYRNYFDMQRSDEVVWRPYSEELIASLPPNCRAGRAIWMAKPLHGKDWNVGQKDYRQDHRAELEMWNNRLDHIVPAGEADPHEYAYQVDDPYVTWYESITIQYISRLGGGVNKAMRLFERLRTVQIMEDIDLDELRSIGEDGVGAMEYLEKWLRKRPPMAPNQPQAEGVNLSPNQPQTG